MSYNIEHAYLAQLAYGISRENLQREIPVDTENKLQTAKGYSVAFSEWILVDIEVNEFTGYKGGIFYNTQTQEVVLASKGTDGSADLGDDYDILFASLPEQLNDAKKLYVRASEFASQGLSPSSITFVGHSLGGSLAMLLGAEYGNTTVTFNPLGVGNVSHKRVAA